MNEEAQVIMAGMLAMAKGQAGDNTNTQTVEWRGIICKYYPASDRISWFHKWSTDITRGLAHRQVISLINIELEACARARKEKYHAG
jgi:hypothetical protein